MKNSITPIKKLLMAETWEETRLSYFKSKGNEDKIVEIAKKLKVIKKGIEDCRWEK